MNNQENKTSISKILNFILELQRKSHCDIDANGGCDNPFLGPSVNGTINFNTRPISIYSCCTGQLWVMTYTLNGVTGESSIFKITKTDGNCATFEILAENPDTTNPLIPYVSTNNFFTMDIDCILAIQCLNDTYTS